MIRGRIVPPQAGVRLAFGVTPGPEPDVAVVSNDNGEFALATRHAGDYEIIATAENGTSVKIKTSEKDRELIIELS